MELLEIEKALSGPDKMVALEKYDGVLLGLSSRLEVALKRGLPPDEFQRCEELGEAVTVARKLLRLAVRGREANAPATAVMPDWANMRKEEMRDFAPSPEDIM